MKLFQSFIILILCSSCKKDYQEIPTNPNASIHLEINYAEGFKVSYFDTYKVLHISNPWPKSDKTFKYALVEKDKSATITLNKDEFDGILTLPLEKIVVTSTTHIPALELLGIEDKLVGFPGCDYVSSEKTRAMIDGGLVRELGKNEGINTEVLLDLKPDIVVGFGVDGVNKTFQTITKANIPVIYNGDWVEKSPLAKAEWLKLFGVLFNKEMEADSIFNTIEADYIEAKRLANNVDNRPTILSGAMHKDIWYLPNGSSPEAQFLKDANVDYLWQDSTGNGSLSLSFETVFNKAKSAEIWLSPSYYTTYETMIDASELYTKFDAFANKKIFTFSSTTGKTGGVLYYELGIARPDLVLKDIIKICHPGLLPDYSPYFFKPLQ